MSYSVILFRREVKDQNKGFDFLEEGASIPDFTTEQFEKLKARLLKYGYQIESENNTAIEFNFKGGLFGIRAALYKNQLTFRAGTNEHGVFEVSQFASESTNTGEFAKLDMQEGKWEEN